MSFLNTLGGLSQGLLGGLGQVRENNEAERRKRALEREELLRAMQEKRLADQAALAEAQMQYSTMEDGIDLDPNDPVVSGLVKRLGAGAFVKGTNPGMLMRRPNPQTELARLNLTEAQANQLLAARERKFKSDDLEQRAQFMLEMENTYGPQWRNKLVSREIPREVRQAAAVHFGRKPEDFLTPDEQLEFSPTYRGQAATAAAMMPFRQAQAQNMQDDNITALYQQFTQAVSTNPALKIEALQFMNNGGEKAHFMKWLQDRQASGTTPSNFKVLGQVQ